MKITPKILIFTLFLSFVNNSISRNYSNDGDNYVRDACSVTRYQNLCINSLASFSHTAKNSPNIWARAGISVTIGEAKNVTRFLKKHKETIKGKRSRNAILDCIECFEDSIDDLHRSLGVLRNLDASKFDVQMGDATTWLSAALTDENTCLDGFGFDDQNSYTSGLVRVARVKVSRAIYITSNALALVNKLASTGLGNN